MSKRNSIVINVCIPVTTIQKNDIPSKYMILRKFEIEPICEKTNNLGSNEIKHNPACTVTEAD